MMMLPIIGNIKSAEGCRSSVVGMTFQAGGKVEELATIKRILGESIKPL